MYNLDTIENLTTGLATSRDKSTGSRFQRRVLSVDQLEAAYTSNWVARKAVEIVPRDMIKNWRSWIGDAEKARAFRNVEKQFKVQQKLQRGFIWANLYGGAALFINDGGDPRIPLDPDRMRPGQIRSIDVASTRRISRDVQEFRSTLQQFREPEFYYLNTDTVGATSVHKSRVIPIHGMPSPDSEGVDDFWGQPVIQIIYDAVVNASKAPQIVSALLEESKTDIIKVKGLANKVSTQEARANVVDRYALYNLSKSIANAGILDMDEEDLITRQLDFANLDKIQMVFMLFAAASIGVPATTFIGQSAVGLSATGEGDHINYLHNLIARQNNELAPVADELDNFLFAHAFGTTDPGIEYKWNSMFPQSPKQNAETLKIIADALGALSASSIINAEALKKSAEALLCRDDILPGFAQALAESEAGLLEEFTLEPIGDPDGADD